MQIPVILLILLGACVGLVVLVGGFFAIRNAFRNSLIGQILNGVKQEVKEGKVGPEDFKLSQAMAMGVTETRLFMMGMPNSRSISWAVETSFSAFSRLSCETARSF